ncbi:RidA family protein [Streptomyces sp. NPDC087440]|uniref:RidA family protein n=1 Tax=Streptomyces sp. NPDC087440 TaxID=3365790 RepID=UPI0038220FFE
MHHHIDRPAGSPPVRGYSHAVVFSGRTVAISGQVPLDAEGQLVGKGNAELQTRQVFENIRTALEAAGGRMTQIVKLTVFLTDLADLDAFRRVRDEFLGHEQLPACSLVQVSGLVNPEFRIEVEALAAI